jgi:8-amino-7-oxononanoate synthase
MDSVTHERSLREPLGDLWSPEHWAATAPGGLLDIPAAQRWFDLLRWGAEQDLYTYQQPLDGRAGARVWVRDRSVLVLSSCDYLGLIGHPAIEQAAVAALRTHGTGTGGVRLLTGTVRLHRALEDDLAAFKGADGAVTFSSGYVANLAAIAALFGPEDRVIADAFVHRSLVDACVLARVPVRRFPHNDLAALERELVSGPPARRTLIVADGVYSMDGDLCPLPDLVELKRRHGAFLLVDEAHALGVVGRTGRGVHEHFELPADCVDIWTGSLSKAIASNGGFVAGSRALITYLQHASAPFIFSAALCPSAAGAARTALEVIGAEPDRIARLHRNASQLRQGLAERKFRTGSSTTPIVPVLVGDDVTAYRLARRLLDHDVWVTAVVHPAVPRGQARLRLCASAAHTEQDIESALNAFTRV